MTQAALATKVGLTIPSLRQAEQGLGMTANFLRLAAVLGQEIDDRSLLPGAHLGSRLAAMRTRRG